MNHTGLFNRLNFFKTEKDITTPPVEHIPEPSIELQPEHIESLVDMDKVETLICLESLLDTCYQTLAGMVHNQTIRKECQQFEQHSQYHQEELRKIFHLSPKNEEAVEAKVYKYLFQLKPPSLSLNALINVAINLTRFKMDIYKYLSHTVVEHQRIFNYFLEDSVEEMDFLIHEKKFHQERFNNYLKV